MPARKKKAEAAKDAEHAEHAEHEPKKTARKAAVKKHTAKEKPESALHDEPTGHPEKKYVYSVGRRKSSVARVKLYPHGSGSVMVNQKNVDAYFPYFEYRQIARSPLKQLEAEGIYDVDIKVFGGGTRGQAEAVRLGISRALILFNADFRGQLRKAGFLTRDPRVKERKKPGLKRARRAPQFSKR